MQGNATREGTSELRDEYEFVILYTINANSLYKHTEDKKHAKITSYIQPFKREYHCM
jgi:hypothetical protein